MGCELDHSTIWRWIVNRPVSAISRERKHGRMESNRHRSKGWHMDQGAGVGFWGKRIAPTLCHCALQKRQLVRSREQWQSASTPDGLAGAERDKTGMMKCYRCEDSSWVCENHPDRPCQASTHAVAVAPEFPAGPATHPARERRSSGRYGRASRTMLNGVSVARRTRPKPPPAMTSRNLASPACPPSAAPTSCAN